MYCMKCGNILNEGAAFCPKCGNRIGNGIVENQNPSGDRGVPRADINAGPEKSDSKRSKRKTIIIAAVCVILVIVVFKIGFSYAKSQPLDYEAISKLRGDDKAPYKFDTSVMDDADKAMEEFCADIDENAMDEPWQIAWSPEHTIGDPIFYVFMKPGGGFKSPEATVSLLRSYYGFDDLFLGNAVDVEYIFVNNDNTFSIGFDEDGREVGEPDVFDSIIRSAGW